MIRALLVSRWFAVRPYEGAQAQLFASAVARRQSGEAIQVLGGYGYTKEFPAERYYGSCRAATQTAVRLTLGAMGSPVLTSSSAAPAPYLAMSSRQACSSDPHCGSAGSLSQSAVCTPVARFSACDASTLCKSF